MDADRIRLLKDELHKYNNSDKDFSHLFYKKSQVDELLDSMKKYLNK